MKVLVTGATGFIGSHLTRLLLAKGCEVGALVQPNSPMTRLQDVADRLTILRGDLQDQKALRSLLADWTPEVCVHLAWYAVPGKYLQAQENIPALISSLNLLQILMESGCSRMISAGTCAEYDASRGWLQEDGPTHPETLYAASKLSFCLLGEQMARVGNFEFAWARLFYPYGPWEDPRRMVPALIHSLLAGEAFSATKGDQIRDYLHVEDIAQAFWTLIEFRASGIYNVGSGTPVTVRRLMETIGKITGKSDLIRFGALPYREWEPRFLCADTLKLRTLGWSPHFTLASGLEATVDWWQNNRA